eukprot:TRINITY_DN4498_c0_g1_i2.p1 TRINITY_DN4498_c0_g1~~TRINITY_DN4498_c0_g1_i2.p1  ORF type:complete len:268 (-),score=49.24 TRINITY_DN4498_c0_g1_i2:19-822(-)
MDVAMQKQDQLLLQKLSSQHQDCTWREKDHRLDNEMNLLIKFPLCPPKPGVLQRQCTADDMVIWPVKRTLVEAMRQLQDDMLLAGVGAAEKGRIVCSFVQALADRNDLSDCRLLQLRRYVLNYLYRGLIAELDQKYRRLEGHFTWARTAPEFAQLNTDDGAGFLTMATRTLAEVADWVLPEEKLACVCSCARHINSFLTPGQGADDFTPALIYVASRCAIADLPAQLAYIRHYHPDPTSGVSGYCFESLYAAVHYIKITSTPGETTK